jgi:DNA repair exonuclease SbcCD ATPase subunit
MSNAAGIRWLAVDGFRGFTRKQEFDLAASAVIITGPNGTGKTCFFDAIQWLLIGQVPRLKKLRGHLDDEYIVSAYRLGEPAVVEAELLISGSLVRVRRSGHHHSSLLEVKRESQVLRGDGAESELRKLLTRGAQISVETLLNTSGLLQQDAMRAVLEGKRAERFEDISHMLGLDELNDFEQKAIGEAKATQTQLNQANAVAMETELRGTRLASDAANRELEISDAASVQLAQSAVTAVISEMLERRAGVAVPDTASMASEQSNQWRAIASGMSEWQRRRELADLAELSRLERAVAVERRELAATRARASAASALARVAAERQATLEKVAESTTRLAALAIPLLTDSCPVCGQAIEPGNVRTRLSSPAKSAELAEATRARDETAASRDTEAQKAAAIEERLSELVLHQSRLVEARDAAAAAQSRLLGLVRSTSVDLNLDDSAIDLSALATHASQLSGALAALATSLAARERHSGLPAVMAELRRVRALAVAQVARKNELERRLSQQQTLVEATRQGKLRVIEERFARLGPLVSDIYQRLDPHPTFTDMEFVWETYRSKETSAASVHDPQMDVWADPLLIFSTSQANISALAYFLALCVATGKDGLPFVLLDDPLQSMDEVNVLGFADLCRFVRDSKQVLLSTHERRLTGLLERKLAPRTEGERTLVIEFESWSRAGPLVSFREVREQISDGQNVVLNAAPLTNRIETTR